MLTRFRHWYRRQFFEPRAGSICFSHVYFIRKNIINFISMHAPMLSGSLLDFGCGTKPYQKFFKCAHYVGIDVVSEGDGASADAVYDGNRLPFQSDSFDGIVASEVLEHVFDIDQVLSEMSRVLRPSGRILLTMPFVWEEHEVPNDRRRYTSYGISELIERHGFSIIKQKKLGNPLETVGQLFANYVGNFLLPRSVLLRIVLSCITILPINLLTVLLSRLCSASSSLYLSNALVIQKK